MDDNLLEKNQYEILYEDSNEVLEFIALENNLESIYKKIVTIVEKRFPENKCSILLLKKQTNQLFTAYAPSLPKFYNNAINGVIIGDKVGSCGSAVYNKKRVIVEDIDTHENWKDYLDITKKANLHSCWSEPIISNNNEILGSFALYSQTKKAPTPFECKMIFNFAHLVAIAIAKDLKNKELITKEQYISKLFENSLSGILHVSYDRILINANKRSANILGYEDPQEMIGLSMRSFHIDENKFLQFAKENFEKLVIHDVLNMEYKLVRKDGSAIWVELSGRAVDTNNPADLTKGIIWTMNDIQERKELELSLKEKNEQLHIFKQAVENINSGVVITTSNKQQNIIYVNKAFEQTTGYSSDEVLGKNCKFLQKQDRDQKEISIIKKAIVKKEPCQVELRNYRKNGEMFHNLLNIAPIFSSNAEVNHFVGIQNDISELKQQERMILEQSKMSAMGEMIANIAHQWRQPLSVITTAASGILLQKEHNILNDEILEENLHNIENNAQYLSKTIDTFRNFIQEKKVFEKVVLQDRIKKALELTSSSLKNNYIELINNIDDTQPITISLVSGELIQVLINIINNAKDILIEKKIENKWIKIDLDKSDTTATITIEDNGGGVQEDMKSKIFTAYFTTKFNSNGTGLGLYMSQKIVNDSLNGNIYVNNTQHGAKFIIELPLKKEP